ncbi:MAG TPA: hypothetical protein VFK81_01510 [Terriglobales bacterium]|jgi:hypothetical protein|nr:hypothetical protein [Terriglobales bacterium]
MTAENAPHGGAPAPAAPASACFGYAAGTWPAVISPCCSDQKDDRHNECTLPGCTCACHNPSAG